MLMHTVVHAPTLAHCSCLTLSRLAAIYDSRFTDAAEADIINSPQTKHSSSPSAAVRDMEHILKTAQNLDI